MPHAIVIESHIIRAVGRYLHRRIALLVHQHIVVGQREYGKRGILGYFIRIVGRGEIQLYVATVASRTRAHSRGVIKRNARIALRSVDCRRNQPVVVFDSGS